MKIVMFSINPIFQRMVTGGASKHLYHIAKYLGAKGNRIEIVCAKAEGTQEVFEWAENVTVFPILPFHLPFPQPYAVSGGDLALIVDRLAEHLQSADRFYIHDGEFLLPDLYKNIPTIISFRDNIYPESVLGSFIGKADDILCVSQYSASVIAATAGRFFPGLVARIHQVNNGIDLSVFKPVDSTQLAHRLGINPAEETILLHPHRPEPGKGLPETIRVTERLVHQYGFEKLKVLVPEWIGSMVSSGESQFYTEMMLLMDKTGVRDHIQLIPWVSQSEMPVLYSLGRVTLCLGNIVEAFGNVAYESLACGTPSVTARVGVHRTLLPDDMLDKVPYGDTESAAEVISAILSEGRQVPKTTLDYLQTHLDFDRQVQTYAEVITTAQKKPSLSFSRPESSQNRNYVLAPWCTLEGEQIYHDFQARFIPAGLLGKLVENGEHFIQKNAIRLGVTNAEWDRWIDGTIIVPEFILPEENKK